MSIKLWDVGDVKGQVGRAIIMFNFDYLYQSTAHWLLLHWWIDSDFTECDFYSFYDGPVDK